MRPPELFNHKSPYDGPPGRLDASELETLLNHWARVRFGIISLDRERCENAVFDLYQSRKIDRPKIIWFKSPLEALVFVCQRTKEKGSKELNLATAIAPNWCRSSFHQQRIGRYLLDNVHMFGRDLDDFKTAMHRFSAEYARRELPRCFYSMDYLAEQVAADTLLEAGTFNPEGIVTLDDLRYLENCLVIWPQLFEELIAFFSPLYCMDHPSIFELVRSDINAWNELVCFPFASIFFRELCVMVDRPTRWHFNASGQLHNPDGGAIVFGDGSKYYFFDGRLVSPHIVEHRHEIKIADIESEEDPFLKRVMLEQMGLARYIEELELQPIDQTGAGRLFEKKCDGYIDLKVLELFEENRFVEVRPDIHTLSAARDWVYERTNCSHELTEHDFETYCKSWIDTALSTDAIDKEQVTEAVNEVYRIAGLDKPRLIFCDSPWQVLLVPSLLTRYAACTMVDVAAAANDTETPRWQNLFRKIEVEFGQSLPDLSRNSVEILGSTFPVTKSLKTCYSKLDMDMFYFGVKKLGSLHDVEYLMKELDRVHDSIDRNLLSRMCTYLASSLNEIRDPQLRAALLGKSQSLRLDHFNQTGNNFEYKPDGLICELASPITELLARYFMYAEFENILAPQEVACLQLWKRVAFAAPFYLFYERTCFVSERPFRLDSELLESRDQNKPVIAYADDYKVYVLRGIPVPDMLVENPGALSADMIEREQNVEIRRVMIDIYGERYFINDTGSEIVDQDRYGTLMRRDVPDEEPLQMVRVHDPHDVERFYYLRVPPTVQTAKEAVAWTFGMSVDEYDPVKET